MAQRPLMVVVGGTTRVGVATLLGAQAAGYRTCSLDLHEAAAADFSLIVDVRDERAIEVAFKQIDALDSLVYVAETMIFARVKETTWEQWNDVMSVNVRGPMLCLKHAAAKLKPEQGSVIMLSSVSAHLGADGLVTYHTSKGGVLGLVRATSGEFAPRGVRVNAVSPGWVDGEVEKITRAPAGLVPRPVQGSLLGRMVTPNEIAEAILFLASSEASFITGTELIVDGGYLRRG